MKKILLIFVILTMYVTTSEMSAKKKAESFCNAVSIGEGTNDLRERGIASGARSEDTNWQRLGDEDGPEFRVFVSQNKSNASVLNIISEGRYNGMLQEVVLTYQAINEATEYLFDMAAFSEQGVFMDGSSSITFSNNLKGTALITNSISNNSIELVGNPTIYGDVYIGKDGDINSVISVPNWNKQFRIF